MADVTTDPSFCVSTDDVLIPVTDAYSPINQEMPEPDRATGKHSVERVRPARLVNPSPAFQHGFERNNGATYPPLDLAPQISKIVRCHGDLTANNADAQPVNKPLISNN